MLLRSMLDTMLLQEDDTCNDTHTRTRTSLSEGGLMKSDPSVKGVVG